MPSGPHMMPYGPAPGVGHRELGDLAERRDAADHGLAGSSRTTGCRPRPGMMPIGRMSGGRGLKTR